MENRNRPISFAPDIKFSNALEFVGFLEQWKANILSAIANGEIK